LALVDWRSATTLDPPAAVGPAAPRSFAGSRTVSSFASGLLLAYEDVPPAMRRSIYAELDRTDGVPGDPVLERRQAQFFARLAVRTIAPRALRRAGYFRLAAAVSSEALAPAFAQHQIGRQFAGRGCLPALASIAYGASAHAATALFYAGHDDINVAVSTGEFCALALVQALSYPDSPEAAWIWSFATHAIEVAIE